MTAVLGFSSHFGRSFKIQKIKINTKHIKKGLFVLLYSCTLVLCTLYFEFGICTLYTVECLLFCFPLPKKSPFWPNFRLFLAFTATLMLQSGLLFEMKRA